MDKQVILARYLPFLERVLTPARLQHSIGVMGVMGELAPVYALDLELALSAGLLHDAAKDLSLEQRLLMMEQSGYKAAYPEEWDYNLYLHGPIGAYFVRRELGIDDSRLLGGIHMHTFCGEGEQFHAPLVWCLRFSDLIEPGRNWETVPWLRQGVARLRKTAFAGRLEEGALLHSGWLVQWFEAAGYPLHPQIRSSYLHFKCKLGLDEEFLAL